MAAGMVNMSHYGKTASASYILRSGECDTYYSNMGLTREEIVGKVKEYCDMEAMGNRTLAIRANADPRNMTKLIISLPNINTDDQNIVILEKLLDSTGVSAYPHIVAIHRGVKDGIENRHAHVSFFERKFEKGNSKKNRYFSGKEFLPDFKKEYQRQFGFVDNEQQKDRKPFRQFEEIKKLENELKEINDGINRQLVAELGNYTGEDIGAAGPTTANQAGRGEHAETGQGAGGDGGVGNSLSGAIRLERERGEAARAEQERLRIAAEEAGRIGPKQKDNTVGRDKERGQGYGR